MYVFFGYVVGEQIDQNYFEGVVDVIYDVDLGGYFVVVYFV